VENNVLGKRTATTREHTVRKLKALYGLDPKIPIYRVMRRFWSEDPAGRPTLALMCAVARDPLLRASVEVVLDTPLGAELPHSALAKTVRAAFSDSTREAIVSHLASSWSTAGFLSATNRKVRTRAPAAAASAAFALVLGFMEGGRGSLLLTTRWTRLLDRSAAEVVGFAQQAAQRGWIEFRHAGDVVDLRVEALLTEEERGWCLG
jgi:hypothetical protein